MKTTAAVACCLVSAATLIAQTDPGPRTGATLSGQPLPTITAAEMQAFLNGKEAFVEVYDVAGGLGPRFNLDSCGGCHSQPSIGGTSPAVNPQVAMAAKMGAANHVPAFLQADGPVRVVRFRRGQNGPQNGPPGAPNPPAVTAVGGVQNLFTIAGRSDAPGGCQIAQPDFSNAGNLVFRIPTPTFGLGLVEAIPDSALRANLGANTNRKRPLGITGTFNTSGNDGTITRFGWKAQNKSLLSFAGEASNVELGVTNDIFPQEREENPACAGSVAPQDTSVITASNIQMSAIFMRFLAPPVAGAGTASTENGRALFDQVGCTMCHTPSLRTGNAIASLANQSVDLYSDLALHRMGGTLNDGITQGNAGGDEWRTSPLWGLGERIFFLHDGRTRDLTQAITIHDSQGSEAHQVVVNFQNLTSDQKQDLLNFLRSL